MAKHPDHPATTAKGASAITILLGVVSVFAPFLFDIRSAILFGAVAVMVIAWIYWTEVRQAIIERQWNEHLNVPFGSVLLIILMAIIAARGVSATSKLPRPLSAGDIASSVDAAIRRNLANITPTKTIVMTPAPQPTAPVQIIVRETPPSKAVPSGSEQTTSEETVEFLKKLKSIGADDDKALEKVKTEAACQAVAVKANAALYALLAEAVNAENEYAIGKDDKKIVRAYNAWLVKVEATFAANKSIVGDVTAFEKARDPDSRPTFLLIHNTGSHAWANFRAKKMPCRAYTKLPATLTAAVLRERLRSIGSAMVLFKDQSDSWRRTVCAPIAVMINHDPPAQL